MTARKAAELSKPNLSQLRLGAKSKTSTTQEPALPSGAGQKSKRASPADDDGPFIPSVYKIEPLEVLEGPRAADEVVRVLSYMEEFRQQVHKDETIIVEGNLEEFQSPDPDEGYYQITLTYCPRYYEQVLKALH